MKNLSFFLIGCILLSFSATSQIIFENHYGTFDYDAPFNFVENVNGDIVMSGRTNSSQGACLLKTNLLGDSLWFKTYDVDTFPGTYSTLYKVLKTKAGYLAGGYYKSGNPLFWNTTNDVFLIKTNLDGDTIFTKIYRRNGTEIAIDMISKDDGSIYFAIMTLSQVSLMKTDSLGNIIFLKDYSGYHFQTPIKIINADNNNLVMLCSSSYQWNGVDYYTPWLVKINSIGDTLWTKEFQVSRAGVDVWDLIYENDNYYLLINPVMGIDNYNVPNTDVQLLTLDSLGNTLTTWNYHWDDKSWPTTLFKEQDGFLISGYGQVMDKSVLTKIDMNGNTNWTYYGPQTFPNDVQITFDGNITLCGGTDRTGYSYDSSGDIYLSKIDPTYFLGISENLITNLFTVHPNPFTNNISLSFRKQNIRKVSIKIINNLGQTIFNLEEPNFDGYFEKTLNLNKLGSGIYYLDITINEERSVKKIMKQ